MRYLYVKAICSPATLPRVAVSHVHTGYDMVSNGLVSAFQSSQGWMELNFLQSQLARQLQTMGPPGAYLREVHQKAIPQNSRGRGLTITFQPLRAGRSPLTLLIR